MEVSRCHSLWALLFATQFIHIVSIPCRLRVSETDMCESPCELWPRCNSYDRPGIMDQVTFKTTRIKCSETKLKQATYQKKCDALFNDHYVTHEEFTAAKPCPPAGVDDFKIDLCYEEQATVNAFKITTMNHRDTVKKQKNSRAFGLQLIRGTNDQRVPLHDIWQLSPGQFRRYYLNNVKYEVRASEIADTIEASPWFKNMIVARRKNIDIAVASLLNIEQSWIDHGMKLHKVVRENIIKHWIDRNNFGIWQIFLHFIHTDFTKKHAATFPRFIGHQGAISDIYLKLDPPLHIKRSDIQFSAHAGTKMGMPAELAQRFGEEGLVGAGEGQFGYGMDKEPTPEGHAEGEEVGRPDQVTREEAHQSYVDVLDMDTMGESEGMSGYYLDFYEMMVFIVVIGIISICIGIICLFSGICIGLIGKQMYKTTLTEVDYQDSGHVNGLCGLLDV